VPAKRKFANISMTPAPTEDQSTPHGVSSDGDAEELDVKKDDSESSTADAGDVVLDPISAPQ
jgi:hypothetical protein